VEIVGNENNLPVSLSGFAEGLHCVGIGTDAAVFYYDSTPGYAFKVYSSKALNKKEIEGNVYEWLKDSPFFPQYYGAGANYLVLSFEKGVTLYDCLLQGIEIPEQVIVDVEEARSFVRHQGLNPRDIHLKNVLYQQGRGKVLDVSEYVKDGNDQRWEHLVWAFNHVYPLIKGVAVPSWILETVKHWYQRIDTASFNLEAFSQRMGELFFKQKR
jgi:hypothetical protein